MSRFQWTEREDKRLRQLWQQGLTFGEIAESMGKTRNMIAGRCLRLGLRRSEDDQASA